jgi:hypothetical protein
MGYTPTEEQIALAMKEGSKLDSGSPGRTEWK